MSQTTQDPKPRESAGLRTTADACAYLNISKQTLHRLAARGELKAVKFGTKCTRWRLADLQALAAR